MREFLAREYLKGEGIEIGGLNNPLPPHPDMKVRYVDRAPLEEIKKTHGDVHIVTTDYIIDDAQKLLTIPSDSLDFLIANHVLEHCEHTLDTLRLWTTVLKVGGRAMIALPDATQCFDRNRPLTPWTHLLADFYNPGQAHNFEHYLDWFMNSEQEKQPHKAAAERALVAFENEENVHFHCWDRKGIRELFVKARDLLAMPFKILDVTDNGSETITIIERV